MRECKMVHEVEIVMVSERELEMIRKKTKTASLMRKKSFLPYLPAQSQDGTVWR